MPLTHVSLAGLFHRGVAMSASPVGSRVTALTHQRHLAVRQAQILNCPTDNSSIIFDCLMTKPWKALGDSLPKFWVRIRNDSL